jgi:hypothetical protein
MIGARNPAIEGQREKKHSGSVGELKGELVEHLHIRSERVLSQFPPISSDEQRSLTPCSFQLNQFPFLSATVWPSWISHNELVRRMGCDESPYLT